MYRLPKKRRDPLGVVVSALGIGAALEVTVCWAATQRAAWEFYYQGPLGRPFFRHWYPPFNVFAWAVRFDHPRHFGYVVHRVFLHAYGIIGCGSVIVVLVVWSLAIWRLRALGIHTDLHGSAHWATASEVKATGLVGEEGGVYVGSWVNPASGRTRYLRDAGTTHCLAFMPTGSGKTVGLVIPTLLSWERSVVVHDLKGEIWEKTAGWRASSDGLGQRVYKFDPSATDGSSVRLNPFDRIRIGTKYEIKDVQNIVELIADDEKPTRGDNRFWVEMAKRLLVGLSLHVKYDDDPHNDSLSGVAAVLADTRFKNFGELFTYLRTYKHDPTGTRGWEDSAKRSTVTHPLVAQIAAQMLSMEARVQTSIVAEAQSFLTLYCDPIVEANTTASDFDLSDLLQGDVSLYLVVQPPDKKRLRPLTRLIVTQIMLALMDTQEQVNEPRVLVMLDEAAEIGSLEVIPTALTLGRGYGIKLYVIAQDLNQLESVWGSRSKTIIANCAIRIASAPNDVTTAELLSKMCGMMTVQYPTRNYSGNRMDGFLAHTMLAEQDAQRPLLTPDEVMRLPGPWKTGGGIIVKPGNILVFVAGHAPIYAVQPLYFDDPTFAQRAAVQPPTESFGTVKA